MKKFIEIIAYSNTWISLGAVGLVWLFYQLNELGPQLQLLAFIFFSTMLTYTFQRFAKFMYGENVQGPRMDWMRDNLTLTKAILIVSLIGTTVFSFSLSLSSITLLGTLAAISFFYAFKFELVNSETNLRDIPGIKIFLIGLVWTGSCVLLPSFESGLATDIYVPQLLGVFFFIVGITIPFDIRDLDYDESSKRTIPQLLGVKGSVLIAILLLIAAYFFLTYPYFSNRELAVGIGLSALVVLKSNKKRGELYFSFLVDGLLVLIPFIYYLLKIL